MSLDEIRRKSKEEYRRAWRLNKVWLGFALILVVTTPKPQAQAGLWELGSALFLVAIICMTFVRSKKGRIGTEWEHRSLSIKADPYRNELEGKRHGLLFWAGGGLFGLLPGAGATLLIFLIAFPLATLFMRWMAGAADLPQVSGARLWIAFLAFMVLCVAWAFVRSANLRAAEAMRRELETLDSSDDDR